MLPHHSSEDPFSEKKQSELFKEFDKQARGEKARAYSQGKLNEDDDGDLVFKIGTDPEKEKVVIDFGKQVIWIGMSPQDAIELAQLLIRQARNISKTPLTVVIN